MTAWNPKSDRVAGTLTLGAAAVLVYRRDRDSPISDDVRYFLTALLLVVGGMLPIVNPVGSARRCSSP